MLRTFLHVGFHVGLHVSLLVGLLAAAVPAVTVPVGAAEPANTGSGESQRMRLMPRHGLPSFADELRGTCAGLTVTIRARIEGLKALEAKAVPQQWPPLSAAALWARRPMGGDIAWQRERIAQLNAALRAKGCQTVNVQTELQRAPAAGAGAKRK